MASILYLTNENDEILGILNLAVQDTDIYAMLNSFSGLKMVEEPPAGTISSGGTPHGPFNIGADFSLQSGTVPPPRLVLRHAGESGNDLTVEGNVSQLTGENIHIKMPYWNGTDFGYLTRQIVAINGNVLTLDSPLEYGRPGDVIYAFTAEFLLEE